jgi:hypothetical protein
VRTFNQFDEGNDPYGEHDFGAVNALGTFVPMEHCKTQAQADKLAKHWNRLAAGVVKKKPPARRVRRGSQ